MIMKAEQCIKCGKMIVPALPEIIYEFGIVRKRAGSEKVGKLCSSCKEKRKEAMDSARRAERGS